jgi:hypothetical protein
MGYAIAETLHSLGAEIIFGKWSSNNHIQFFQR